MTSRSKTELIKAENMIKDFLNKNNNNPEEAWDAYVKYHLKARISFPCYIRGIKDFIKVSRKIERSAI